MKIITLAQGSKEWHDWRAGRDLPEKMGAITATMPGVIMGVSPFQKAYRLWEELTGRATPKPSNSFMLAGQRNEPRARELYEQQRGEGSFTPYCIESSNFSWMRASLDGINAMQDRTAEIKCPGEKSHMEAKAAIIVDAITGELTYDISQLKKTYIFQMQWQMLCTDGLVTECDFVSYFKFKDGTEDLVVIPVPADPKIQQQLMVAAQTFRQCLFTDTPPSGDAFLTIAGQWLIAKMKVEEAQAELDLIATSLLEIAPQGGQGNGVIVSVSSRKGSTKWADVSKQLMAVATICDGGSSNAVYIADQLNQTLYERLQQDIVIDSGILHQAICKIAQALLPDQSVEDVKEGVVTSLIASNGFLRNVAEDLFDSVAKTTRITSDLIGELVVQHTGAPSSSSSIKLASDAQDAYVRILQEKDLVAGKLPDIEPAKSVANSNW